MSDTGYLVERVEKGFKIFNRKSKSFEIVDKVPQEQEERTGRHLRDLYHIAKRYGIKEAIRYELNAVGTKWTFLTQPTWATGLRV